jgi:heme a synthase
VPRWLHYWAVVTVCSAIPLVFLGAEVTTKQIGMVDQVSFRAPWHLLTLPLQELAPGYKIEHTHRLFGFIVGTCSIVLAFGLWFRTRHPVVRWLGWLALGMVSIQGILGIGRVALNALYGRELALVHGCFAQLTFATLMAVAVMTSTNWLRAIPADSARPSLRRFSLVLVGLIFLQVLFGAIIRHVQDRLAQRAHVVFAFVVLGASLWVIFKVWELGTEQAAAKRWAVVVAALIGVQLLLGVEAWMGRFGSGVPIELQRSTPYLDLIRSGHYVIGLLIFSTTVILSLLLHRGHSQARALRREEVA